MRKLLLKTAAGIVLAGVLTVQAQAQTSYTNNNFTTGFTPKNLKNVPIDTSKFRRQYANNSGNLFASSSKPGSYNLSNMLPRINLPGVGSTNRLSNSSLTNSALMQKANALQK